MNCKKKIIQNVRYSTESRSHKKQIRASAKIQLDSNQNLEVEDAGDLERKLNSLLIFDNSELKYLKLEDAIPGNLYMQFKISTFSNPGSLKSAIPCICNCYYITVKEESTKGDIENRDIFIKKVVFFFKNPRLSKSIVLF